MAYLPDVDVTYVAPNPIQPQHIHSSGAEHCRRVIQDQIRSGMYNKIQHIKDVRSALGWGIKEAKDFIDEIYSNTNGNLYKVTYK